ncbi:MAG: hypothetical protein ACRCRP_01575 [Metamycoplasmataceae bacterium]
MNKKKFLWPSLSLITPAILATVAVTTSCSQIPFTDNTFSEQIAELTSESAKKIYKNNWIKSTISAFFLKSILKTEVTSAKITAISDFLTNLTKKDLNINFDSKNTTLNTNALIYGWFETNIFNNYKDWVGFEKTRDNNWFNNQVNGAEVEGEFKENWSNIQIYDFNATTQKWEKSDILVPQYFLNTYTDYDFFPGAAPDSAEGKFNVFFEQSFKKLYNTPETDVQNKLLEMLLTSFYFNQSSSEFVLGGTTFNKDKPQGSSISTFEGWQATNFDENDPNYFLIKYLVDNTPFITWNIKTEDAKTIEKFQGPTGIKEVLTFDSYKEVLNKLQPSIEIDKRLNKNIKITSSDSIFNNNFSQMKGFNSGTLKLDTTGLVNDLNVDRNNLIYSQSFLSGFINKFGTIEQTKDTIISFDQLNAINTIQNSSTNNGILHKVTLKPNSSSTLKAAYQITQNDLILPDPAQKQTVLQIVPNFSNSSADLQEIIVYMNWDLGNGINYKYNVKITWNINAIPDSANIYSDLANETNIKNVDISNKYFLKGINTLNNEKKALDLSYVIKLVPKFKFNTNVDGSINFTQINNRILPFGKFSIENFKWSEEDKYSVSNLLYLFDSTLFDKVKQAFVWNDYSLDYKISQLSRVFAELGLGTLTASQRLENKLSTPYFTPITSGQSSIINDDSFKNIFNQIISKPNGKYKLDLKEEVDKYERRK